MTNDYLLRLFFQVTDPHQRDNVRVAVPRVSGFGPGRRGCRAPCAD
jgi:hypothetical protein